MPITSVSVFMVYMHVSNTGGRKMGVGQSVKEEVLDMPRGDGRGPAGFGPMTGRSAGFCAGYGVPGYANPGVGGGAGARGARCFYGGGGFGRGYRRMYYPSIVATVSTAGLEYVI